MGSDRSPYRGGTHFQRPSRGALRPELTAAPTRGAGALPGASGRTPINLRVFLWALAMGLFDSGGVCSMGGLYFVYGI